MLDPTLVLAAGPQALKSVCGTKDESWQINLCRSVYDGSSRVPAEIAKWVTTNGLNILVIFVVAWIVNRILRRLAVNVGRRMGKGGGGRFSRGLAALRRVTPDALLETQEMSIRSSQRSEAVLGILKSVISGVVYTVAAFAALGEVGINLGPLIAGAGVLGVALGFGAQSLVGDFLAGVFILIEDQFGVGDLITFVPSSGGTAVVGYVEAISLRNTRLRATDGSLWHVPNGEVRTVGNQSQHWSRVVLDVTITYDSDLARAKATISRVAEQLREKDPSILEPPEMWGVQELANTGVTLRVVVKTTPAQQFRIMRALREGIKLAFDEDGIRIPVVQEVVSPASPPS